MVCLLLFPLAYYWHRNDLHSETAKSTTEKKKRWICSLTTFKPEKVGLKFNRGCLSLQAFKYFMAGWLKHPSLKVIYMYLYDNELRMT